MIDSLSSLPAFLLNGVSLGLNITLVALAMALIWRTVGMIDFGLGAVYLVAAYSTLALRKWAEWPLTLAILGALVIGTISALVLYGLVYRHFLRRSAPLFVLVLVALSVSVITQNLFATFLTPQKFYFIDDILPGFEVAGTRLNVAQIAKMGVSLVALAGVALFCLRTRPGETILAVADNKQLAQGVGISADRVYLWTYGIAGLVVSLAAIPDVAETGVDPYVASNPVFLALAAIIIGGLGQFRNPVLGALLLGVAFHLAVWAFSASWQEVIAYGLVILVLVARPQGLFGGMNIERQRA